MSLTTRVQRRRRDLLLFRLRARAVWNRVDLDLQVAEGAFIGRRVRIHLDPRSSAKLVVADGAVIHHDATIYLHSGEVHLGPGSHLRSNCVLNIRGRFELGEQSIIGWGTVIHCGSAVTIGAKVGVAENCTVADSVHFFTDPETFWYHNTRHAPVVIGSNTWVAAGVTITSGTTIGDYCILGSGAVVNHDVPSGHIVSAPRMQMREGRLPWKRKAQDVKQPTTAVVLPPDRIATTAAQE
jgi:acetyltransferase-like isoleucine patch superfamily enzyme